MLGRNALKKFEPHQTVSTQTAHFIRDVALLPWLILVSQIVVGLVVYAFAAKLPFFWDDVTQNEWLSRVGLPEIWTATVPGLNYFRPIAFSVWKLIALMQGEFDPVVFHKLNVLLHILNATLVGVIACRICAERKLLVGIGAATLFTLFPFSFQAVAPVNSLMHPLHAMFVLASVWWYLVSSAQEAVSWRLVWPRVISVVLAGLAVLAHENGILACVLIVWTALCIGPAKSPKRILLEVAPYALACALGYVVWRAVPRLADPLPISMVLEQGPSRLQNGVLFLQGFASLFTPLAGILKAPFGPGNESLWVNFIAVASTVVWLSLYRWRKPLIWAAGWFLIAALPALTLLDFSYIFESPRLLYLASAGAALFWALPMGLLPATTTALRRVLLGVVCIATVASAGWGWMFIARRGTLYEQLGQSVAQLHAATLVPAPCQNRDGTWLVINYPEWFFVPEAEYVFGHDGITSLSEGSTLDGLVRSNYAQGARFEPVTLPDIARDGVSFKPLGPMLTQDALQPKLRSARGVIVNRSDRTTVQLDNAGCLMQPQVDRPIVATFDSTVHLVDVSLSPDRTNVRRAALSLDWLANATPKDDVTVFVQVLNESGQLVAQADGYPLAGTSPMRLWHAGDRWRDVRTLELPASAAPGAYRVIAGVYRTNDTARLTARNAAGQVFADNAVPIATWSLAR